ncbi:PIG-L family deacetylase [Paenibacillus sp. 1011MAR3C5]|uniref:PIG-L deacetylase family protein n=1 Tax=Paenibacillus sp. 1011MAR3C5 TaxID=1675787 RepID=UPI000E6BEFB5|nr:PIG-L family deacetylase [Paenibacillus sp. 1011MAR3C5]RJE90591.1 PIG-L family deacetylase [Paenibacillus sp. 1011MAR3C5]
MNEVLNIMVIGAHPDEPDIYAGGTAALFVSLGHRVKFLSLTDGCCGHQTMDRAALVQRRKREAELAKERLGLVEYEVLDTHDGELLPTIELRQEVIRQIRRFQADVVISFHPEGGRHPDNRYAGHIVGDAAPFVRVPLTVQDTPIPMKEPIYLLMPDYSMKERYSADLVVDIGEAVEQKLLACDAHATQFYEFSSWGQDHPVPEDWEGKKQFLLAGWASFFDVSEEMLPALEQGYGKERASRVRYAEPFEFAPYASRPSEEQLQRLFPMLRS